MGTGHDAPPLQLTQQEAQRVTSYSSRRKRPSVAGRAEMSLEQRAQLGDWRDPVRSGKGSARQGHEPMAVRYSAARLDRSDQTRLFCLALMSR